MKLIRIRKKYSISTSYVWISTIYNKLIKGATLEDKVLAVQKEQVKLHLSIDKNQDKGTAHWFNYAPTSVNIMYSMPLVGESARLYFPKESSEDPIVIGCIRQNGDTCDETSTPANKYFQTESGNEIAMLPNELYIKGGSNKNIIISFDDKKGVHLKSPKKLSLNASGEIILKTKKKVKIKAHSKVSLMKRNEAHGMSIEGDFNIKGNNVIMDGSSREAYAPLGEGGDR